MWKPILAISLGSSFGALLRWGLGNQFNSLFPTVPPGTLTANLIGGYIIGSAVVPTLIANAFFLPRHLLNEGAST